MIIKRILRYGIAFLFILLTISLIVIYQYKDFLAAYFSNSISTVLGTGLYLLIFAVAIILMFKAILR